MSAEAFANNWSYLKVELNNLERLLLAAVAKQKKEQKESDRVLPHAADRASQHWLQGLISLDGPIGYDTPPPPRSGKPLTYQQQITNRLQATQAAGQMLALPALCDRLRLTIYEKNLILLGIAPEIHRRYAKLYEYLNDNNSHLLTVDLSLRLLCRNDQEWRLARNRLKPDTPLMQYQLIDVLANDDRPFLQHPIRLSADLVHYLLAEQTLPEDLERLLAADDRADATITALLPATAARTTSTQALPLALDAASVSGDTLLWQAVPTPLQSFVSSGFASHLVLPEKLRSALQQLAQAVKLGQQLDADWGFGPWQGRSLPGQCVLLVGAAGTGKAAAAAAIAQYAGLSLEQIDLSQNIPLKQLCQQLQRHPVPILLVCHAAHWLSRQADVSQPWLDRFFQLRQRSGCLTLFTVQRSILLPQKWRSQITQKLIFPQPNARDRAMIWQRAFPPQVTLDAAIDWEAVAGYALSGGEIMQTARTAALLALAEQGDTASELRITIAHLQSAITRKIFASKS